MEMTKHTKVIHEHEDLFSSSAKYVAKKVLMIGREERWRNILTV